MSEIMTAGRVNESEKGVVVLTTRPALDNLSDTVTVLWHDRRQISPEQRRKAYALLAEIGDWQGMSRDQTKLVCKREFLKQHIEGLHHELFSLSDCDMTTAREFISYLIDLMLEFDIPSRVPLYEMCDDIGRYVYACLMQKKCAVCGLKAELHHVDRVGMGYNRKEICHIGMRCLPLCRGHHDEVGVIGERPFEEKYHLIPVEIDDRIAKKYNLRRTEK